MAKADLAKSEMATEQRAAFGAVVERTRQLLGLNINEFADLVGSDRSQVARWIDGLEPTPIAKLFAVPRVRQSLVVAFAECSGEGVIVETIVTVRRTS